MRGMDTQLGGGYLYQWECAMLLALNCFFELVPDELYRLVAGFLERVDAVHLEGEDRQQGVELEDINLIAGERRILIQVKTKEDASASWRVGDRSLLKALFHFYNSPRLTDQPDNTRFVFLTNRQLHKDLLAIQQAVDKGTLNRCPEACNLLSSLNTYAEGREKPKLDNGRFREMLARTTLLKYQEENWLKSTVQLTLRAYGRSDWQEAHNALFEYFARESTRKGGGRVTRESIAEKLGPKAPDADLRRKELAYLDTLLRRYHRWKVPYTPLAGIAEVEDDSPFGLPPYFVCPELLKLERFGIGSQREERWVPVDDLRSAATEHKRILLLGEPGSGKTTTLWELVYEYATAAREASHKPLPLFISLSEYREARPFYAYLAQELGPLAPYVATYLGSGRLVLLLDGLNEMPRADYADRVRRIRELLDDRHEGIVVVTCRKLDYEEGQEKLQKLQEVEIKPLDETGMQAFLHKYLGDTDGEDLFWEIAGGDEVRTLWDTWQGAGGTWAEFWTAEEMPSHVSWRTSRTQRGAWEQMRSKPPPLLVLGRIPYLLSLTAEIFRTERKELPVNRARLFGAFVGVLLDREGVRLRERRIDAEELQNALAVLAYAMQERGSGTTVKRAWAEDRLSEAVPGGDAKSLLYLATSATLLDATGASVRFYHQLLQAYFAAVELERKIASGKPLAYYWPLERWWEPSGWEEAVIFLAGMMKPSASSLLRDLRRANPVVAGRCLVEGDAQVDEQTKTRVVRCLRRSMTDVQWPGIARAHAGSVLGRLGDPRPGAMTIRKMEFCYVPRGPFWMGSDEISAEKKGSDEPKAVSMHRNEQLVLYDYWIGRFPVTNAQFRAFIRKDGYSEPAFWREAKDDHIWDEGWIREKPYRERRDRPYDFGHPYNLPNHPVVGVTWYEAKAFARWLDARLHDDGVLSKGWAVCLPSEAEWEKAARGGLEVPKAPLIAVAGAHHADAPLEKNPLPKRAYPWGNEADPKRANYAESGIGTTSAVGCFPSGTSPYGVEDLSGNVWEWTRSGPADYRGRVADGREDPKVGRATSWVLRGGAFDTDQWHVRCAYRHSRPPNLRNRYNGFRVAVIPVPPDL